jgi:hypothetical protein
MSTTLEDLIVRMDLDSAKFRQSIDQTNGALDKLGKRVEKLAGEFEAKMAFDVVKEATKKLFEFVHQGAELADQMIKTSRAVGVPVEQFSKLAYAAQFSGLQTDELAANMFRLNKAVGDAATGGQQQQAVFKALGINIKNASGGFRNAGDIIGDVADKFSHMKDGAAKSAMATELFGKTGAKMISLLDQGREGLAAMGDEAERFGLVVTSAGGESAERFNDDLNKLKKVAQGVSIRVAQDLAPSLANLVEELLKSKDGSNAFQDAAKVLAGTMRVLASGAAIVAALFQAVGESIAATAAAGALVAQGEFRAAGQALKNFYTKDLSNIASDAVNRISAIWSTAPDPAAKKQEELDEKQKKAADALLTRLDKVKKAQEAAKKAAEEAAAAAKKADEERKKMFDKLDDLEHDKNKAILSLSEDVSKRRDEYKNVGETGDQKFTRRTAGFESFDAAMTQYEKLMKQHEDELANVKSLEAMGQNDAAEIAQANANNLKKMADSALDAADAFKEHKEQLLQLSESFKGDIKGKLFGASGAGDLINSGMQGAAAGGPMGAVAGIVTDLLVKSKTVGAITNMVGDIIQMVADAFGSLLNPLKLMVAGLTPLAQAIGAMISPFAMVFDAIFDQFVPLLVIVGELFKSLAPVAKIIATGLTLFIDAIMLDFTPIVEVVFEAIRLAAIGIDAAMSKFAPIWNGMLDAIEAFLRSIGQLQFKIGDVVFQPFSALNSWADNLEKGKMSVDDLAASLAVLENLSMDEALAKAKNIAATNEQTETVKEVNRQLSNVPNAFRIAMREYDSQTPQSPNKGHHTPHFAESGTVYSPGYAYVGDNHEPEHIMGDSKFRRAIREELANAGGRTVNLNVFGVTNVDLITQRIMEKLRLLNFQKTGSLVTSSPRFAGGSP